MSAQKKATAMYDEVEKPFQYYSGISSNSMDYQILLIYIITILCVVIAAPVFTSDYQTGADDILRCTKHGRRRMAVCKILSALLILRRRLFTLFRCMDFDNKCVVWLGKHQNLYPIHFFCFQPAKSYHRGSSVGKFSSQFRNVSCYCQLCAVPIHQNAQHGLCPGSCVAVLDSAYAGNECVSGRVWTVAAKHPSRRGNRYGK